MVVFCGATALVLRQIQVKVTANENVHGLLTAMTSLYVNLTRGRATVMQLAAIARTGLLQKVGKCSPLKRRFLGAEEVFPSQELVLDSSSSKVACYIQIGWHLLWYSLPEDWQCFTHH